MGFIKCPRCELNYIEESEGFCKICKREMQGDTSSDDTELCTICNERPALPGREVCAVCLKEMKNTTGDEDVGDDDQQDAADSQMNDIDTVNPMDENMIGTIGPVSSMDEIIPDIADDIPEGEYNEIENELSLDAMEDEEEAQDEDDEESD